MAIYAFFLLLLACTANAQTTEKIKLYVTDNNNGKITSLDTTVVADVKQVMEVFNKVSNQSLVGDNQQNYGNRTVNVRVQALSPKADMLLQTIDTEQLLQNIPQMPPNAVVEDTPKGKRIKTVRHTLEGGDIIKAFEIEIEKADFTNLTRPKVIEVPKHKPETTASITEKKSTKKRNFS